MTWIDKTTTRRDFFKDVALGTAGVAFMGSLGSWPAAAQENTKHGHLVRKINYNMKDMWKMMGPGNADLLWWPKGKELEGKNVNFSFGYYTKIGDWHTKETGGHVHPDGDELLIYVGLDPDHPEYLGAEVEHDVGTEYEKHVFRVPLACCFPRNVVHCPQITLKCDKPYGFIVLSLDSGHETKVLPQRSTLDTTDGNKYGNLYKKLVFRRDIKAKTGPGNAEALAWLRGKDVENFNVNFAWGFYKSTGDWGAKPHKHVGDQFLVFVGLDNQKPDYLGAEIEVALEDEKHVINSPSCIIIPAGLQHAPIVTKNVEKPFGFYTVRLDKGDPSDINPA
jgi:hypothetical protein